MMTDQEIRNEIRYQVQRKVIARESFTAYDITQELRRQHVRGKHDDWKLVVHEMFDNHELSGYSRELRDMGGPIPAWYYFHRSDHTDQQRMTQAPAFDPTGPGFGPVLHPNRVPATPSPIISSYTAKADARETICVPAAAIKQLGLQPGDDVVVIPDSQAGELILKEPGKGRQVVSNRARFYTVDKDCNVRITRGAQLDADVHGDQFDVMVDGDEIIISTE